MDLRAGDRKPSNIVLSCVILGREERAILCDVSLGGCRIELFDGGVPQRGSTIIFDAGPESHFAGEIVWVRGIEAGVRFTRVLSPEVCRALEL